MLHIEMDVTIYSTNKYSIYCVYTRKKVYTYYTISNYVTIGIIVS